MGDALIWWIVLEVLGLVALPLAAVLLRGLPDRGYTLAKTLGLLLTGWLAYTLAMLGLVPFGRPLLAGCVLLVAALSAWLLLRDGRALWADFGVRFRHPSYRRTVITAEVLFAVAYVIWAVVRAYNPDIDSGQEKFMDFGFLNAILRSPTFPPHDMWLAGAPINYYYFGYVLMAALTSLSGVPSAVGFNLANVTLYALTALGGFGLVYNLIAGTLQRARPPAGARQAGAAEPPPARGLLAPYVAAVLGALMLVAMGNLTTVFAVHTGNAAQANGWRFCFFCQSPTSYDWFAPSRIIQDYHTVTAPDGSPQTQAVGYPTINEFPAFSFLLADLHPHVLALPLVLLVLGIALSYARRRARPEPGRGNALPRDALDWLALAVAAIAVGALYTTNTWDYPTYALLVSAGIGLPYLAAQRRSANRDGWGWLWPWLGRSVLLAALSLLAFAPFHLTFKSLVGASAGTVPATWANVPVLGWVLQKLSGLLLVNTADKTIGGFLVIFGIFVAILVVWLGYELAGRLRRQMRAGAEGRSLALAWGGGLLLVWLVALLLRFPLLALLLPMAAVALVLVWQEPGRIERNMALGFVAIAALIGLAIEIVFLRDNFQMRMNTLFKFYYQIWVLWAVAAAYAFWRVLYAAFARAGEARRRAPGGAALRPLAAVWAVVVLLLVGSGLLYSYYGPMARQVGQQAGPRGLDGAAWFARSQPDDFAAITWLNAHAQPTDVVLEAGSDEYQRPGRVSAYTGVPTLVAWDNSHESLWRANEPDLLAQIRTRRQVVNAIYQGVDPQNGGPLTAARLLALLHQYGVTYVFVGATEHGVAGWAPSQAGQTLTAYAGGLFQQALAVAFQSGSTVLYSVQQGIAGTGEPPAAPGLTGTPAPGQFDPSVPPVGLFARGPAGANRGQFNLPRGIARDAAGDFYVVDTQNMRVQEFDPQGTFLRVFGSKGSGDGQFAPYSDTATGSGPGGIAVDAQGNVYVADTWNHRIEKFDKSGNFLLAWGGFLNLSDAAAASDPAANTKFYGPRGVAVGPDGAVYVTDTGNKRILVFDANGTFQRQISAGADPTHVAPTYAFNQPGELNEPMGLAVDAQGNVYVADTWNHRIQKFNAQGTAVAQWPVPAGAWDPAPYLEPYLALDAQGNVYATAPSSHAVLKFSPTGTLLGQVTSAGSTALQRPTGITVDPDGTVYVVDTEANAVVRVGAIPGP